jgi:hypothetical protein
MENAERGFERVAEEEEVGLIVGRSKAVSKRVSTMEYHRERWEAFSEVKERFPVLSLNAFWESQFCNRYS